MKTVIIGDIHGRDVWEEILEESNPDKIIFLGDYWDDFHISFIEQKVNFLQIAELKRRRPDDVTLLFGNHDAHYLRGWLNDIYSGYQDKHALEITYILEENMSLFKMCTRLGPYLLSHAGVSAVWMDDRFGEHKWNLHQVPDLINNSFHTDNTIFQFRGLNMYGDHVAESPIWIRPSSLDMANLGTELDNIKQIVGHTQSMFVDLEEQLDTFRNLIILDGLYHGVYGVYENEELTFKKLDSYVTT